MIANFFIGISKSSVKIMKNKIIFIGIFFTLLLLGNVVRYTEHYSNDEQGNQKALYEGFQLLWGDVDSRVVPENGDPELVYHRTETYFFGTYKVSTTGGKGYISMEEADEILNNILDGSSLEPVPVE